MQSMTRNCHVRHWHGVRPLASCFFSSLPRPGVTLDSAQFQGLWSRLGSSVESSCELSRLPSTTEEVENLLSARSVNTMASGNKPAAMKFFFYAKVRAALLPYYCNMECYSSTVVQVCKRDVILSRVGPFYLCSSYEIVVDTGDDIIAEKSSFPVPRVTQSYEATRCVGYLSSSRAHVLNYTLLLIEESLRVLHKML